MRVVYQLLLWVFVFCRYTTQEEKSCRDDLGMKSKGIPDESIAASSSKSADNSPQFARLDGKKAWCSAPTDKEPHIQINLVEPKSITGITTQGSFSDWAWVTKYEVKYLEKGTWKHYDEEFEGNKNINGLKPNTLDPPIRTQSIRIYPKDPVTLDSTDPKPCCLRLELYGCSAPADCKNPGHPSNGKRNGSDFGHGKQVNFTCTEGFMLVGSATSVCHKGTWSHTLPQCKATCKDPGVPVNGKRKGKSFVDGDTVEFTCDENFSLSGSSISRCLGGRWSVALPECKASCPDPGIPVNGERVDGSFEHGKHLQFKCKPGFWLVGSQLIFCNEGTWSNEIPTCRAVCRDPGVPENGIRIGDDFGDSQMVAYRCNENFNLVGSPTSFCIAGHWNTTKPTCKASCPDPGVPSHGRRIGSNFGHGGLVTFLCLKDFNLIGSQSMTCHDGKWSSVIPVCKASCKDPGSPNNGFRHGNDFDHNKRISFTCLPGFQLTGTSNAVCINGKWSASMPQCKAVCVDPGKPVHGNRIGNTFLDGQAVAFSCQPGHTLIGAPILRCVAGKWNKPTPECKASCPDPVAPINGRAIDLKPGYRHGERAKFSCDSGFKLIGSSNIRCLDGNWSSTAPLCTALCPTPIAPTNGRIQGRDFRHGRSIKFWCSRGYTRVGAFSVTCKEGKWGAPFPVCKDSVASCGRPSIPANGRIVGNIFSHGKSILFYCSFGYSRVGVGSIKCDDGKWDKPFPVCKGICPTPSNPRNGKLGQKVSLNKRFLDGDEATFSCNRGYDLIGKKRLRCVGKVWNFGEPECKAPCNPPRFPANGNGQWRDLKHNSWVTFSCNKKYQLEGRRQIQCKDGSWSGNRPKCVAVCPDPGEPLRGKRHGNNFRNGSIITFTCNTDHELIGDNTTRCEDGVWSGSVPLCKGKCKFEGSPKNGYTPNGIFPNGKLFSHGSNIEYACYATYTMDGTNILHCNDGFWNASIPSCKAPCTDPGLIDRGKRNGTDFSHGQVVTYECSTKNYSLVGNPRRTCNDGVWDSALPVCKKSCKPLPLLSNGKIHNNGVSHGAVVSFSCNSGFQPQGSLQMKCLDGIWNESSPSCIGACAKPGKILNGTVVGSNYSYGSVIKFKCNKGYKLRGSAKLKCKRGVWESQFPECEECVRVGAVFWGFWKPNLNADNYWKASITRITATHFDFALVNNNKQTRSYRRTDQKLIIDKVPSIGNLLPNSPVIAHQFGHSGWYRTGYVVSKVTGTSGNSLVEVQFDDGKKKWVKLGRVRLVSYPDFCSNVE